MKQNAPLLVQEYYVSEWSLLKSSANLADKIEKYIELTGLFKNRNKDMNKDIGDRNKDIVDRSNAKITGRSASRHRIKVPITCYNCSEKGHLARNV